MATATTATSRRAKPGAAALETRRKDAEELLNLNIKLAPQFKRTAELEAALKAAATKAGDGFKEDFGGKGYVSASGAVEAEFKGNVPQIQTEKWLALTELDRKRILKTGAVKIVKSFGRASHGSVTVKVL